VSDETGIYKKIVLFYSKKFYIFNLLDTKIRGLAEPLKPLDPYEKHHTGWSGRI